MNTSTKRISTRALCAVLSAAFLCGGVHAEVKPNGLFSDGVVLQQGVPVPVWGSAKNDEKVTVKFQDQTVTATAKDGRWMARLKPLKAGGPFVMMISGENTITITNVLIGEVWLCSGQSNMEMPLTVSTNSAADIAAARDPLLHLFTVPHAALDKPIDDVSAGWKEAAPDSVKYFSAVAYYFGRDLRKARNVPVGLIHSSVGGTPAEAWTPHEILEADPELKKILDRYAESVKNFDPAKAEAQHAEAVAKAQAEGKDVSKVPAVAKSPAVAFGRPSGLYNAMIHPLLPFAIKGVIWYQGEENNWRPQEYEHLLTTMIHSWWDVWDKKEFPFLFVQIAPHKDMKPEIREAQFLTWQKVPHTAMAVITDVGEANDIHPKQKEPVGARLALAARAMAYGEHIEYSGPAYHSVRLKEDSAIVEFTHIGDGLVAQGGELTGFTIAGADGKFLSATAKISGDTVIVSNPSVTKPTAVRYGLANVPDGNLYNKQGLPASPFRTDVK